VKRGQPGVPPSKVKRRQDRNAGDDHEAGGALNGALLEGGKQLRALATGLAAPSTQLSKKLAILLLGDPPSLDGIERALGINPVFVVLEACFAEHARGCLCHLTRALSRSE
jgi:peptide deformylase